MILNPLKGVIYHDPRCGTALPDIEARLGRINGCKYLRELRKAIQREFGIRPRESMAA